MNKYINKNHIAIEGIDGCGKSTFIKLLNEKKIFDNKNIICDCSPFDEEVTKIIRKMLKNEYDMNKSLLHKELLSLFMLDNHIHDTYIKNKLSENEDNVIVTDRFIASTFAYQTLNNNIKDIIKLYKEYNIKCPGLILYFDISPKISLERINSRNETKEIFEKLDTLEKVRSNYLNAFKTLNKLTNKEITVIKIDASLPKDDVCALAYKIIDEYLLYGKNHTRVMNSKISSSIYNTEEKKCEYLEF